MHTPAVSLETLAIHSARIPSADPYLLYFPVVPLTLCILQTHRPREAALGTEAAMNCVPDPKGSVRWGPGKTEAPQKGAEA